METTPQLDPMPEQLTDVMPDEAELCLNGLRQIEVVLHGAAGNNVYHLESAIRGLRGEGDEPNHPVHAVDMAAKAGAIAIPHDHVHFVDTPEGQESLDALFDSGRVHAEYISLIPRLHKDAIINGLSRVADGKVDMIVVPKPAVQNLEEAAEVDRHIEAIKLQRAAEDPDYDPEADQFLFVHEHYKEKGAWATLRKRLGMAMDHLGRLDKVEFHIRESQIAEAEGRTAAFGGGAIEDLAPHILSLGLDVENAHSGGRYRILSEWRDQSIKVQTAHYEIRDDSSVSDEVKQGEKLAADVDTGFRVDIGTKLYDREEDNFHNLNIRWVAGKGLLEDRKEAWLEFVSPEGVRSVIVADLKSNTLVVPSAVGEHFPNAVQRQDGKYEARYIDNGYGDSVEQGLNGGDPRQSFQSWDEAKMVIKSLEDIKRDAPPKPTLYALGDLPDWLRD